MGVGRSVFGDNQITFEGVMMTCLEAGIETSGLDVFR